MRSLPRGAAALFAGLLALAPLALEAAPKPGNLDKSFGGDGRVLTEVPGESSWQDAYLMRDGRIVVVGEKGSKTFLARYRSNGKLDESFSGNGWMATDVMEGPHRPSVLVQPDRTIIVVAGVDDNTDESDFGVMKLSNRGRVKTGFGSNGLLRADFGGDDQPRGIARAPQSKFYAIGSSQIGSDEAAIARFNANGTLDTNTDSDPARHWSEDGLLRLDVGDLGLGLKVLNNGKVLTGAIRGNDYDVVMARFNSDGMPDTTFHGTGQVELPLGNGVNHVEKINFGLGGMYVGANIDAADGDIRVARFTLQGAPDPSFDDDGMKKYDLGANEAVTTITTAVDGRISVVGEKSTDAIEKWLVLRLKHNGERDRSFGRNGAAVTRFRPSANDESGEARDVDIQADGRILTAGVTVRGPSESDFDSALARFHSGTCGRLGTNQADTFRGTPARDYICGRKGGDTIRGQGGKDRLVGGPGPDLLNGGVGDDVCIGGGGKDTLVKC